MPASKQKTFPELLEEFKKNNTEKKVVKKPRLVLIIMANTHDPELNTACAKDAKAVGKVFADICEHIHYELVTIEISGENYNGKNLEQVLKNFKTFSESDVAVFYYTGHGFSYEKEYSRRKYPQVDMRPHNNQVKYNKINFIEEHTENLAVILAMMRFNGFRINIAIGDCCNTSIPFKRPKTSEKDMNVILVVLPNISKRLTQKMFVDEKNSVSILVSSSQHGQPAVTDPAMGSIFTHHFTKTLANTISTVPKGSQYLPWLKLLKQTASQAFKDSKAYDIGGGKAGKQKAVFDVFVDQADDFK